MLEVKLPAMNWLCKPNNSRSNDHPCEQRRALSNPELRRRCIDCSGAVKLKKPKPAPPKKQCTLCGNFLTLDNFSKDKDKKDKLATRCRSCRNKRDRERRAVKRDHAKKTAAINNYCHECRDNLDNDGDCLGGRCPFFKWRSDV